MPPASTDWKLFLKVLKSKGLGERSEDVVLFSAEGRRVTSMAAAAEAKVCSW